ncbi:PadR family transcriptional regulator [Prauserella shujinwangii]|uniref:PadR family transcriptional regulator n=1 Tax=Prauserella shujinwangii TaxID=1453103 RepID=A0A2T0LWL2_9PSEU|nr:PadR family transcriptional regulator [Prauserella shujinwangii]PRX48412.1 PadR family transcriptional regulator [Prauserella shujinwangii]
MRPRFDERFGPRGFRPPGAHRHGGFGGFGGFGPGGPGGPGPFPGGPGPRGRRRGGHGHGRRGRRGDVRSAVLTLLAEQPRHGYEIIGEIGERSGGFWQPSPGSVYPTLQLLADEGLVRSSEDGGKRLYELTDEGRAAAGKQDGPPPWEHFAKEADPHEVELRDAAGALMGAMRQVWAVGTSAQQAKAIEVINDARRALYGILGESPAGE